MMGGGGGPQVNKCEQVSSLGHQMSLAVGTVYSEVPCLAGQELDRGSLYSDVPCTGDPCMVRSYPLQVMVIWAPVNRHSQLKT